MVKKKIKKKLSIDNITISIFIISVISFMIGFYISPIKLYAKFIITACIFFLISVYLMSYTENRDRKDHVQ